MKNRIIIDFDLPEDLSGDNICMLNDDLKDFIENHELTYYATNISVKFQDEYCIKEEKKKLEKHIPKKPHPKEKYNSGYAIHCPTCNNYICLEPNKRDIFPANIANIYCRHCGQALDWNE